MPPNSQECVFACVGISAGLNWKLFPDGVEGWVTVSCAIGPLPLSRVCRFVTCVFFVKNILVGFLQG